VRCDSATAPLGVVSAERSPSVNSPYSPRFGPGTGGTKATIYVQTSLYSTSAGPKSETIWWEPQLYRFHCSDPIQYASACRTAQKLRWPHSIFALRFVAPTPETTVSVIAVRNYSQLLHAHVPMQVPLVLAISASQERTGSPTRLDRQTHDGSISSGHAKSKYGRNKHTADEEKLTGVHGKETCGK
jgi:hypothetical protein